MLDTREFKQTGAPALRETRYPPGWPAGKRARFDNQDQRAQAKWPQRPLA